MGIRTARRVYILFLSVVTLQIIFTGIRQVFDFLGPLWSMILTNFLNIVFSIFGFFGGYTRRKLYLVSYALWCFLWIGWNVFIICLYIPLPELEGYKSPILSLGTGGLSWWETRAPGCYIHVDWANNSSSFTPSVTNCIVHPPHLMEFIQAGVQILLALIGVMCATPIIRFPQLYESGDKDGKGSTSQTSSQGSVPAFLSLSRQNVSSHNRGSSSRLYNRAPMGLPPGANAANHNGGDSSDQVGCNTEDRLRPMTPRRVKRRSARSIQSSKFGPPTATAGASAPSTHDNPERPSTSKGSSGGSARSSLRSNASRRSHHRSSKRKSHFISPINRLIQQVDSETSHDEPRRFLLRDQGHANPVYQGAPSPKYSHAPPRPPSARSSYSNYHPARLPANAKNPSDLLPNVINLNQNIFTNGGFDMSTEYNYSQNSNTNASTALYEDHISYHPNLSPPNPPSQAIMPNGINLSFKPQNNYNPMPPPVPTTSKGFPRLDNGGVQNSVFAYPLAHSPVSQESFPMWGVSQPQSPVSNHFPSPPYQNRRPQMPQMFNDMNPHPRSSQSQRHPMNSETVI